MKFVDKFKDDLEGINQNRILELLAPVELVEVQSNGAEAPPEICILTGRKTSPHVALTAMQETGIYRYVDLLRNDHFRELTISSMLLCQSSSFVEQPLAFVFNDYKLQITRKTLSVAQIKFSANADKPAVLEKVDSFFRANVKIRQFRARAVTIVDELFMNAISHARRIAVGLYHSAADMDRYPRGLKGLITVAFDRKKVLVMCTDPFGTLNIHDLVTRMIEVTRTDQQTQARKEGPAGLGYRLIIENSSSLYAIAARGRKTVICCTFPYEMGLLELVKSPKNFHMLETE